MHQRCWLHRGYHRGLGLSWAALVCYSLPWLRGVKKSRNNALLLLFNFEPSHNAASGISEKFELCGRSHFPAFNYLEDLFIAEIAEAAKITGVVTRLKTHI